jgi:hypothetical protein
MSRNLKTTGAGNSAAARAAEKVSYWTSSQESADHTASHIDFADK